LNVFGSDGGHKVSGVRSAAPLGPAGR
jgi:hypothetical protein